MSKNLSADVTLVDVIRAGGSERRLPRGATLWWQGDASDTVAMLRSGAVKIVREWNTNNETVVEILHRGCVLGAEAASLDTVRPTSAVALTTCRIIEMPRRALLEQLSRYPHLWSELIDSALSCWDSALDSIGAHVDGRLEERTARALLRLADRHGIRDARGVMIPLSLSRADLASMLGVRVETVTRLISRWRKAGVLSTQREGMVLRDLTALRAAGRVEQVAPGSATSHNILRLASK